MTDRELLDRKGHEVNDDLPTLPEPVAWMIRNLVDTEVQPWPTRPDSEAYALASVHQGYECSPLYTADQLRAAVLAERERCAKVCEADPDAVFSAIWKSLVIPGEFDAMDETDKNRWRGVIMQAIGFTAELKAAAIRGVKT